MSSSSMGRPMSGASGSTAEENAELWKSVGTDTEAGRLLRRLYAGKSAAKIHYPEVRTRPASSRPAFIPGGARPSSDDPRAQRRDQDRVRTLHVPSVAPRRRRPPARIDAHAGKRRSQRMIDDVEVRCSAGTMPVCKKETAVATWWGLM